MSRSRVHREARISSSASSSPARASKMSARRSQTLLLNLSSSSSSSTSAHQTKMQPPINFTQQTIPLVAREVNVMTVPILTRTPRSSPPLLLSRSPSSSSSAAAFKFINSKKQHHYSNNLAFLASLIGTLFIMTILLSICIDSVTSLSCYSCSSHDNPACDETFGGAANSTSIDCDRDGKQGKVCRKLVQYIEAKKVVIRECGYLNEHENEGRKSMCQKRSGTFAVMQDSCICYEDNCNHSASLVPNQSVLMLLLLAGGFFMLTSRRRLSKDVERNIEH